MVVVGLVVSQSPRLMKRKTRRWQQSSTARARVHRDRGAGASFEPTGSGHVSSHHTTRAHVVWRERCDARGPAMQCAGRCGVWTTCQRCICACVCGRPHPPLIHPVAPHDGQCQPGGSRHRPVPVQVRPGQVGAGQAGQGISGRGGEGKGTGQHTGLGRWHVGPFLSCRFHMGDVSR